MSNPNDNLEQLFIGSLRRHSRRPMIVPSSDEPVCFVLISDPMEWDEVVNWMNEQVGILNPQLESQNDWMVNAGIRMAGRMLPND